MDYVRVPTQQLAQPSKRHNGVIASIFVHLVALDLLLPSERLVDEVELGDGEMRAGYGGRREKRQERDR